MLPAALFGDLMILPAVLSLFRDHSAQQDEKDRENSHEAVEEDNRSAQVEPVRSGHDDCWS